MTRTLALVLVAGSMAGCMNRTDNMDCAVRFDQNGNKMCDETVRNTRSPDMHDGYRGQQGDQARSWDGGMRRDEWNTGHAASSNTNWAHEPGTAWRNNAGDASDNAWKNNRTDKSTWNNNNNSNSSNYSQDDRRAWRDDRNWQQKWDDKDVTMVQDSDLPSPVRSTFNRESGGAQMMQTGRVMHDGKTCYCTKVQKNGMTYKMVSDADGNLIAMKRVD